MAELINLNYFFRSDNVDYQLILKRGFFDNHKTIGEYGKGIYLTDKKEINLSGKNIILNVDLKNTDDILFVETYESLLKNYIPNAYNEYILTGRTSIIGKKYIKKYAEVNGLNGIKIKNENILVLYNVNNIKRIVLFDENLKTLRNYSIPTETKEILVKYDENSDNEKLTDNDDNDILYDNF